VVNTWKTVIFSIKAYIFAIACKCTFSTVKKMDQNELAKTARMALPFFASGTVVHGFGRGSKELGVPTANLADEVVDNLPDQLTCGVYCGFASVNHGTVYPMVSSC